jgi:ferredoxin
VAPPLFRVNEQRLAVILKQPENEQELEQAKTAVKSCPRHAIRLKDV